MHFFAFYLFSEQQTQQNRFQWGRCIYLGWVSGLTLSGGAVLQYFASRPDHIQDEGN